MLPANSDKQRRSRKAISAAMKAHAEARKCPECRRKFAIKKIVDGDYVARVCRWCKWESGDYILTIP